MKFAPCPSQPRYAYRKGSSLEVHVTAPLNSCLW